MSALVDRRREVHDAVYRGSDVPVLPAGPACQTRCSDIPHRGMSGRSHCDQQRINIQARRRAPWQMETGFRRIISNAKAPLITARRPAVMDGQESSSVSSGDRSDQVTR